MNQKLTDISPPAPVSLGPYAVLSWSANIWTVNMSFDLNRQTSDVQLWQKGFDEWGKQKFLSSAAHPF